MPAARRSLLAWSLAPVLAVVGAALPTTARAGSQREEDLADSVRTALSAAVSFRSPPVPVFASTDDHQRYDRWLAEMSRRLTKRKPEALIREDFLQTVWYESRRAGLDVSLVLGLIEVESAFRKYAISSASARGYMQVMPFWVRSIGDGDVSKLFHMQTNIRFGCVILRFYLDREQGDLFMALGRYNGSRGQSPYPNAVLGAQKRWQFDDRAPGLVATG